MRDHLQIDQRSLAMHRLMADKIRRHPALFDNVKSTLSGWRASVCQSSQPYLEEWERLVQQGMEACLAVAEENSERATAMRQASPFCKVLTNKERFAFLNSWSQQHEAQRA